MEAEYLELQITSFREQILHGAYAYPRPGDFRKWPIGLVQLLKLSTS